MITMFTGKKAALLALALIAALFVAAPFAMAQEEAEVAADPNSLGNGLRVLGLALGAGIAIVGGAIATARAQAAVGAGGTGALAEKPELFGNILILFAIPETLVVFAFVIAIMMVLAI
jgi:V/A-type H+/Na+-transporting ATPase subunit K